MISLLSRVQVKTLLHYSKQLPDIRKPNTNFCR